MSISEDLARTGSANVYAQMFTDFPPGFSKLVSEQSRSSSTVTHLFSSLLVPCYCVEETTIIIIIRIFTQDNPSVHCTAINGVLHTELN